MRADIEVTSNGAPVAMMHPEKRAFTTAQSVTSETAIDRSIFRDLYLALGDEVGNGAWTVRVYHKPLVNWIWGGALLMALGGAFAVSDRRYALAARKEAEQVPASKSGTVAPVTTTASGTAE
jgi:cytochrome c-type biogenesis protein CcmF